MKSIRSLALAALAFIPVFAFAKGGGTFKYGDISLEPEDFLTFSFDGDLESIGGYEVLTEFLPDGVAIEWTGKKFVTPKAGSIKWDKEMEDYVDKKDSENPAGLKLSINKKTGIVKGSFKIYAVQPAKKEGKKPKLKSFSAKVSGRLGGDSLTVTVKKGSSFAASLD